MATLPTRKAEELRSVFENAAATDAEFFYSFLEGRATSPAKTPSLAFLSEHAAALSDLFHDIFAIDDAPRCKSTNESCRAGGEKGRSDRERTIQKVVHLWDGALSAAASKSGKAAAQEKTRDDAAETQPPKIEFAVPSCLYEYIRTSAMMRCTPGDGVLEVLSRGDCDGATQRFRWYVSRFMSSTFALAQLLHDASGQPDDAVDHGSGRGVDAMAWDVLRQALVPQSTYLALTAQKVVESFDVTDKSSFQTRLLFGAFEYEVCNCFFRDARAGMQEAPAVECASDDTPSNVDSLEYFRTLDAVRASLQGVKRLGDDAPMEEGTPASNSPTFTGVAAFVVRSAHLTIVHFVDRVLASLESGTLRTAGAPQSTARAAIKAGLEAVLRAAPCGNSSGDGEELCDAYLESGITGEGIARELVRESAAAPPEQTHGAAPRDLETHTAPSEGDNVALEAYFERRKKLLEMTRQRCLSLAHEDRFVAMAHRENLPDELLKALAEGERSTCDVHSGTARAAGGAEVRCSHCLLQQWLPHLSEVERAAVLDEKYDIMEEMMKAALNGAISLAVQSVVDIRVHLDAVAELSRTAKTATAMAAEVAAYFSTHAELFGWAREKVTAYAEAEMQRLRKREEAQARRQASAQAPRSRYGPENYEKHHVCHGSGLKTTVFVCQSVRLSDIVEDVQRVLGEKRPAQHIVIAVQGWLTVDTDLRLPCTTLCVVAERIFVANDARGGVFQWSTAAARDGYDGVPGKNACCYGWRSPTRLDGKSGGAGESGTPGGNGGDIFIQSGSPIQFESAAGKLSFVMDGGNGGHGGRAGDGADGKNAEDKEDSFKYYYEPSWIEGGWFTTVRSFFAIKGAFAADMPGRGGNSGLRGAGGLGGKPGSLTIVPAIPDSTRRCHESCKGGVCGKDGGAGNGGKAGDGGCDGMSNVGFKDSGSTLSNFGLGAKSSRVCNGFFAKADFNARKTATGTSRLFSVSPPQQNIVEANKCFWSSSNPCGYEDYVVCRRLDRARQFVNHGVLYNRASLEGKCLQDATALCESPAAHLSIREVMASSPFLVSLMQQTVGSIATPAEDDDEAEHLGVDGLLFEFEESLLSALEARLGLVHQLLQYNLSAVTTRLRGTSTIEEVLTDLQTAAQHRTTVALDAQARHQQAAATLDATPADDSSGEEPASSSAFAQLFHDLGTKKKSDAALPCLPHSFLLVDCYEAIERYNESVRLMRRGRENVFACLALLSAALACMRGSKLPLVTRYVTDLFAGLHLALRPILLSLRGDALVDDFFAYTCVPCSDDVAGPVRVGRVHPCHDLHFGSLVFGVLAFQHARSAVASLEPHAGATAATRRELSRRRAEAEAFLTSADADIAATLRAEEAPYIIEKRPQDNVFRLFGPLLFPANYATEPHADTSTAISAAAYAQLVELNKATFGQARFPLSKVAQLDAVCRNYCTMWSTFSVAAWCSDERLTWMRSQTAVETYRYLLDCASGLSPVERVARDGLAALPSVPQHVRAILEEDGDSESLAMRRVQLEMMYRWRVCLRPRLTVRGSTSSAFFKLLCRVLQRALSLHLPSPDEAYEATLCGMLRGLFVAVYEQDNAESTEGGGDFAGLEAKELRDTAARAEARTPTYTALLDAIAVDDAKPRTYTSPNNVVYTMAVNDEVARLLTSFKAYLRGRALLFSAMHAMAQFYYKGHHRSMSKREASPVDCPGCASALGEGAAPQEGKAGAAVPPVPCMHCQQSADSTRRVANQFSYVRLVLAYTPWLTAELALYPAASVMGGGESGGAAGPMSPCEVAELLWCASFGVPQGAAQRRLRVDFPTLVAKTEPGLLSRFLAAALVFMRSSPSLPHELYGGTTAAATAAGLPCRGRPHNAERLARFLRLSGDDTGAEKIASLVRDCGDDYVHDELSTWRELQHVDCYSRGDRIPHALFSSCVERLERLAVEVELRAFAKWCFSEVQRVRYCIDKAVREFSQRASLTALRLCALQAQDELRRRAQVGDAVAAPAVSPIYPEVFQCVLTLLCGLPIELDSRVVNEMVKLPLNEWLPDLAKLAHSARLYTWAPWLHEVRELCWSLALEAGERLLPKYFDFLRTVVKDDYSAKTHYRLLVLLETPASLCLPEEKLRLGLQAEPETWRAEMKQLRRDRAARRMRSRAACESEDARRAFIEEVERGWAEIGSYLQLHNTPVSADMLQFCKQIHDEVHHLLGCHAVTEPIVAGRFSRFQKEYDANRYSNGETRERFSLHDVQVREQQLWSNKRKLQEVLVTVFLAFYQGKYRPRRVQVVGVVALLCEGKACLANINTGEGKTYICGCFAAVKAYLGYTPLMLSCNDALAKEACAGLEAGLQLLFTREVGAGDGAGNSFGCHVDPAQLEPGARGRFYKHPLLYATLFSVIGDILRSLQRPSEWRFVTEWLGAPRWVVLDEADTVMVGSMSDAVYIGDAQLAFYKELLGFPAMLDEARKGSDATDEVYKDYLSRVGTLCVCNTDPSLQRERFDRLLDSAREACAVRSNAEFVSEDTTTYPYDIATGSTMSGSVWRNGVSVLLNIKEGSRFMPETDVTLSMAALTFLQREKATLTGVTGTAGNYLTRVMYRNVYGMETWELPPAFPSQLLELFPRVTFSEAEFREVAYKSVQRSLDAGQSCLCIQDTIHATQKLSDHLGKVLPSVRRSTYVSEHDERPQLHGRDDRAIFCTTQRGGRGLDITVNHPNGLAEFLLSPQEERNTYQAERRAARQYDNGSAQRIFHDAGRSHPLRLDGFDVVYAVAEDEDGYYTGEDAEVLTRQAVMLNAFYAVQNEAVMQERRRLCRLVDRSIPVTLFFDSLQEEKETLHRLVREKCGPVGTPGDAVALVVQHVLQRRYAQWLLKHEKSINEDGGRPLEQRRYREALQMRLSSAVTSITEASQGSVTWAATAVPIMEDEDDVIDGAAAVQFELTRLGPYFSTMTGKGSAVAGRDYAYPTIPLYLALEAVQRGLWKSEKKMDAVRRHLRTCSDRLSIMSAALERMVGEVKETQKGFGVQYEADKGTLKQLSEWITFTTEVNGYIATLIGQDGVVHLAFMKRLYNPDANLSSLACVEVAKVLLKNDVLEIGEPTPAESPPPKDDDDFVAKVEKSMDLPKDTFGQDSDSFAQRFTRELKTTNVQRTTALLTVLASGLPGADDVTEYFACAARAGLVGQLRVHSNLFHLHSEDYVHQIEQRLKDTTAAPFGMSIAQLCVGCVGRLRVEHVEALSVVALDTVIDRIKTCSGLVAPFTPLGLHQTVSVSEHEHCRRVREEMEEEEGQKKSWWGWLWRGIKAVCKFVGAALSAAGIDALLQYCFPVLKSLRVGLDCVKFAFNAIVSKIKTGSFELGRHLKTFAFSVATKLFPTVLFTAKEWLSGLKGLAPLYKSQVFKGVSGLYKSAKNVVGKTSEAIGKVTSAVTSKVGGVAFEVSDAVGTTAGVTSVYSHVKTASMNMLGSHFSASVKEAYGNAVMENMKNLLIENISSRATATLTDRLGDGTVSAAVDSVADELTREALLIARAVKRKVPWSEYSAAQRGMLDVLNRSGVAAYMCDLCTSLLSVGKRELLCSLVAGRAEDGSFEWAPGQGTMFGVLNTITNVTSHVTAAQLLLGSTATSSGIARREMQAIMKPLWTWAKEKYDVNEADARALGDGGPAAEDERTLVASIRGAVSQRCLAPVQHLFADVVNSVIDAVQCLLTEVQKREKERCLQTELAMQAPESICAQLTSGFLPGHLQNSDLYRISIFDFLYGLQQPAAYLQLQDIIGEGAFVSAGVFGASKGWSADNPYSILESLSRDYQLLGYFLAHHPSFFVDGHTADGADVAAAQSKQDTTTSPDTSKPKDTTQPSSGEPAASAPDEPAAPDEEPLPPSLHDLPSSLDARHSSEVDFGLEDRVSPKKLSEQPTKSPSQDGQLMSLLRNVGDAAVWVMEKDDAAGRYIGQYIKVDVNPSTLVLLLMGAPGACGTARKLYMTRGYLGMWFWKQGAKEAVQQNIKGYLKRAAVDVSIDLAANLATNAMSLEDQHRVTAVVKVAKQAGQIMSAKRNMETSCATSKKLSRVAEQNFTTREKRDVLGVTGRTKTASVDKRFAKNLPNISEVIKEHCSYEISSFATKVAVKQAKKEAVKQVRKAVGKQDQVMSFQLGGTSEVLLSVTAVQTDAHPPAATSVPAPASAPTLTPTPTSLPLSLHGHPTRQPPRTTTAAPQQAPFTPTVVGDANHGAPCTVTDISATRSGTVTVSVGGRPGHNTRRLRLTPRPLARLSRHGLSASSRLRSLSEHDAACDFVDFRAGAFCRDEDSSVSPTSGNDEEEEEEEKC